MITARRVAIEVRADHERKPGGDVALAKAFESRLRSRGVDAELVSSHDALRSYRPDLLIAFNLDRPIELLSSLRAARQVGAHTAVYALHHPADGVRAYLKHGATGTRGWVATIATAEPATYLHILALLRGVRHRRPEVWKYLLRGRLRLFEDLASLLDHVLISGPSEGEEIRRTMPALSRLPFVIVPHPIAIEVPDISNPNPYSTTFRDNVLIAGRIESRKNQLSVLRIASRFLQTEFVFAGQINETDTQYGHEFKRALAAAPNCRWIGHLELNSLLLHILHADAVLSPSWFEVMSLINLYAYALGTPVISSVHTYDHDLIRDQITRYDPSREGALDATLARALETRRVHVTAKALHSRVIDISEVTWAGFDAFYGSVLPRRP